MRDVELYRHLLGLTEPWTVARVELAVKEQQVDVFADHAPGTKWRCPECARECATYDHCEERVWRHLDSCQFKTLLPARPPRVRCPEHGVKQVRLPWGEPRSRFTALFERLAIDVMLETDVSGAMRILRISWDEAWHIQERAVARGLARKEADTERFSLTIAVDEKSIAKGQKYFTLVYDLDLRRVEYSAEDRTKESLDGYFKGLTPLQLDRIEAVAMDMWEAFVSSAREHLPDPGKQIVFDRFHIMKHATDAVDRVRRGEHRELSKSGNEVLAGSRNAWLYRADAVPEKLQGRLDELRAMNLRTGRARALKEALAGLWEYARPSWATTYFERWYAWAIRSQLEPIKDVARLVKKRLPNVVSYCVHQITTGPAEGLNSVIQSLSRRARGFRHKEHFKTAIFFRCGGLELYPEGAA